MNAKTVWVVTYTSRRHQEYLGYTEVYVNHDDALAAAKETVEKNAGWYYWLDQCPVK